MTTRNFTRRVQLGFIVVLLVALLAIGQPWSFQVYRVGIVVMVGVGLAQVAIGNIPQSASPGRFARLLLIFAVVIAALFGLSIYLAPILVKLGR